MRVRQATHAGSWYSLEQSELDSQLTGNKSTQVLASPLGGWMTCRVFALIRVAGKRGDCERIRTSFNDPSDHCAACWLPVRALVVDRL